MSAYMNALREEATREELLREIERQLAIRKTMEERHTELKAKHKELKAKRQRLWGHHVDQMSKKHDLIRELKVELGRKKEIGA